jgi:hypothetical protein
LDFDNGLAWNAFLADCSPTGGPPSRKKRGQDGATLFWESSKGWASPDNLDMYIYVRNNPVTYDDPFGLYQTSGFSPDQQAQLGNAINEAIAKLNGGGCSSGDCASAAGGNGPKIANAIQGATFVYNPKMKDCGQTGPLSVIGLRHVVTLGPLAFTPRCCSLASTVAHEAVHLTHGGENKAYGVEKSCFGCGQ